MLDGIKVLSTEVYLAGPFATRILQDLGADVIKIENVDRGDVYRYLNHDYDEDTTDDFTYRFLQYNRGKDSIALNLKDERGKNIFKELAKESDVVIENLRPGGMDEFGLGYDEISELNNDIIYCSISGYGQDGPYWDRPAVDTIIQAMSGLVSQNQADAGEPALTGIYIADMVGGMYAAMSVLSALASRSDEGTYIDVSMLDCLVSLFGHEAAEYSSKGTSRPRIKSSLVPQGVYKTKDGAVALNVLDEYWHTFCKIIGAQEWVDSGEFDDPMTRQLNKEVINEHIEEAFSTKSTDYWTEELLEAGIMAAPVKTIDEIFNDEHIDHRGLINSKYNNELGEYIEIDFPAKFSNYVTESGESSKYGEDTEKYLKELGFSDDEITNLFEQGVVSNFEYRDGQD